MIRYICNWCNADTTKRFSDVHVVVSEQGREVPRQYHLCPKCTKELMKLIRKDDKKNDA